MMLAYCLVVRKSSRVCPQLGEDPAASNSMTPIFKLTLERRFFSYLFQAQPNIDRLAMAHCFSVRYFGISI
jgi:hypothetical protein